MSYRAAVLLFHDDKIALIERHRAGLHYYTFPGGHIDPGESPEQAAVRETMEELGLQVEIDRLAVKMQFQGDWQHYFLVRSCRGEFGTGCGEEMVHPAPGRGTYRPCWVSLSELNALPVKPAELVPLILHYKTDGWPATVLLFPGENA